jgi:HSP20 family protein
MFALTNYHRPATTLTDFVDEVLNDPVFGWRENGALEAFAPRVDIVELENAYKLVADVPGLTKDDVKVTVENGVLTISGEKKAETHEKKEKGWHYYERSSGSFSRAFNLPEHVDSENIKANYKNGVLELTMAKKEVAKPKAVEVKVE